MMKEKNLIIICVTAIICIAVLSATALLLNTNNSTNNTTNENDTVNLTLNDTNNTENNTTTATKSTKKTTTKKSSDPDYDPERDASHQGATEDNPVTVQQSDGEYTYYGSGHYDYYAGGDHMSGEYYKYKNSHPTSY